MINQLLQDQVPSHAPLRLKAAALVRALVIVRHTATMLFRLSQLAGGVSPSLGTLVKQINHVWTGADLAWQAHVGPGLVLYHPTGVVWGGDVVVGSGCVMQQGVSIGGRGGNRTDASPVIGDDCQLGAGSRVLGPVTLGDRCVVAANAVVLGNFVSGTTVVGAPARAVLP
jgi:serine O-acetyltransferase